MTTPPRTMVKFEPRVTGGISSEAFPPGGGIRPGEVGGILLGTRSPDAILVEDFEPVMCSHDMGPSYILSDQDRRGLEESLEWFRNLPPRRFGNESRLETLGFYRTLASPGFSWNERDEQLMRGFFPPSGALFLLLKPVSHQSFTAEFFVLDEGILRPAADPSPFPSAGPAEIALFPTEAAEGAVPPPEPVPEASAELPAGPREERVSAEAPEPPAAEPSVAQPIPPDPPGFGRETRPSEKRALPPPTRPRRLESDDSLDRGWFWVAALVLLTVAGAVLGYRSVEPPRASPPTNSLPQPSKPPQKAAFVPDPPAPASASPDPAPPSEQAVSPEMERGIQGAIQRWQSAIRSGDPDVIAACYLPQLERYFNQRNSSSAVVRKAALKSKATYGRPSILRVSGLSIIPVSPDRAIATFRKHWQTAGPRVYGGEEQERMALVHLGGVWKIASEEETKVYWSQRPR